MNLSRESHAWRRVALLLGVAAAATFAGCVAPTEEGPADAWTPSALVGDVGELPEASEIIQRMVDHLQGSPELAVEARVSYEVVQESGEKLQFDMLQRIAIRKPDQVFWVTLKDDGSEDRAWYDQGRFTMTRQPANLWTEIHLPGGIATMADQLVSEYMVDVPFPDILSGDSAALWLGEDVESIRYVGEAWVSGRWTDHVAIRKPGVDIQMWVQKAEPFPAKMAIVFTEEAGLPSYTARFQNWSNTLPDDASLFEFTPPPGAERVDAVPVIGR